MLHIERPKVPVPAELEAAVVTTREALAKADFDQQAAAQKSYDDACAAVREHCASVGMEKIAIPREVEDKGPDAIMAHVRGESATSSAKKRRTQE